MMETLVTTLAAIGLVNVVFGFALGDRTPRRNVWIHFIVGFVAFVLALHLGHWNLFWVLEAHKLPGMNPWMVTIGFLAAFIPLVLMDVSKKPVQKRKS